MTPAQNLAACLPADPGHDGPIGVDSRDLRALLAGPVESNTATHARHELTLLGEEPAVIDWYCRVINEFMSFGHSGGSASICIPTLTALLWQQALTPLTDDPAEWIDQSEPSGYPLWQNTRDSRAFSEDGGKSYWWVHEKEAAGSMETTPIHESDSAAIPDGGT